MTTLSVLVVNSEFSLERSSDAELCMFSLLLAWIHSWKYSQFADDFIWEKLLIKR